MFDSGRSTIVGSKIGCEHAVFHLEDALRDDHAGIGDRGTIGGDSYLRRASPTGGEAL